MAAVSRTSDAEVAELCARGDRVAQRDLFLRTRNAVHHTLYRVLGSNRDIEDLLQETYLTAIQKRRRFDPSFAPLAWLAGKPGYRPWVVRGGSLVIAALASFWMIERALGLD